MIVRKSSSLINENDSLVSFKYCLEPLFRMTVRKYTIYYKISTQYYKISTHYDMQDSNNVTISA